MEEKELQDTNETLNNIGLELVEEPEDTQTPEVQEEQSKPDLKAIQEEEKRDAAYNLRRMREDREALQRERDEMAYRLAQLEKAQKQTAPIEEDDNDGLVDGDLVEARHFKAYRKDVKENKRENAELRRRLEEQTMELQIRTEMPDFSKVVNDASVAELYKQRPKLAAALAKAPNDFDKMAAIYDAVSNLKKDEFAAEKKAVQAAVARPRNSATLAPQTGNTPLDNATDYANGLSDEQKAKNWAEMNNYANY
jgi:hypothetical protein